MNRIKERRQRYEKNREKELAQSKQFYQNNKPRITEQRKQRYSKNKEKELAQSKQWYQNNKPRIIELRKRYRKKNAERAVIYCQEHKEELKKYQKAHPEIRKACKGRRRAKWMKIIIERGLNKCKRCGYDKYFGAIEQHHLNPLIKKISIGRLTSYVVTDARLEELDKCIPLCANCHRELHNHIWNIKEIL